MAISPNEARLRNSPILESFIDIELRSIYNSTPALKLCFIKLYDAKVDIEEKDWLEAKYKCLGWVRAEVVYRTVTSRHKVNGQMVEIEKTVTGMLFES